MLGSLITIGVVVWTAFALACYLFVRRAIYTIFDPIIAVGISIPFSAALLSVLCAGQLVSWSKFELFSLVLLAYLVGARLACAFFGRGSFRAALADAVSAIPLRELTCILAATTVLTLLLGILGLKAGAEGDARQVFDRLFRPVIVLQSGLFLISLLLLATPRISNLKALLYVLLLLLLSVPFSGKGVLVPLVYWYGLRMYVRGQRISLKGIILISFVTLLGAALMAALAYHASGVMGTILLLGNRFWLSGDVYMMAYQAHGLAALRGNYPVHFLSYMMHPITSIIGIRAYDRPLGAMIASEVMHNNLFTGPNPQLPVLVDFFFPGSLPVSLVIGVAIGLITFGIRSLGMLAADNFRGRYLRIGALTAAVFCPAEGFLDFSLVLITLVGVIGAALVLVALELWSSSRRMPITTPSV